MIKARFNETGHAFDERNRKDYIALTKRIERSLAEIEIKTTEYKTKPTQKDLAIKAKCSVETLIHRSQINAEISPTPEVDKNGEVVRSHNGKIVFSKYGWPLSELKRIQRVFKALRNEKRSGNATKKLSGSTRPPHASLLPKTEQQVTISNLRGQNAQLFMENEEMRKKLKNSEDSLARISGTCADLKAANAVLHERIIKLEDELKIHRKKSLKIVME